MFSASNPQTFEAFARFQQLSAVFQQAFAGELTENLASCALEVGRAVFVLVVAGLVLFAAEPVLVRAVVVLVARFASASAAGAVVDLVCSVAWLVE